MLLRPVGNSERLALKPLIVIEHLESELRPWLLLEYRHASIIYGRSHVVFTNVPSKYASILSKYGRVIHESIVELVARGEVGAGDLVVLDPRAKSSLTYEELLKAKYVVIGGILGDHPPRGRTHSYITSRLPRGVKAFNIGDGQYSIDGAVYYVNYLWTNRGLNGYEYIDGIYVETNQGHVYLPFRYPLVNGKPLLADGLEYYLKYRKVRDDIWAEILSQKLNV